MENEGTGKYVADMYEEKLQKLKKTLEKLSTDCGDTKGSSGEYLSDQVEKALLIIEE